MEREIKLETRPCRDCKHYKVLHDGKICRKLLMGVTSDMFVNYWADKGTCFEVKEELSPEQPHPRLPE